MDAGSLVLSACLFVGQLQPMPDPGFAGGISPGPTPAAAGPASADAPMAGPLVPIRTREAVAHHHTLQQRWFPGGTNLEGSTPLSLLQLLSRNVTGPQRTTAVQSYWQLAQRAAELRVHQDAVERVLAWSARCTPAERQELEAALARLEARRNESQLQLMHAQYELAQAIGWTEAKQMPFPVDPPHVGPYRTEFEKIFAGRQAPGSLALLDRVLPVEWQLLQVRAEAVVAGSDSCTSTQDAWVRGEQPLSTLLERLNELTASRLAFLQSVVAYNTNIAEYAMAVAPEQAAPATWVGMLIKLDGSDTTGGFATPATGYAPTPAQPTFRNQALQQQRPLGFGPLENGTLGPPPSGVIPATAIEPTLAPQRAVPRKPVLTPVDEPALVPIEAEPELGVIEPTPQTLPSILPQKNELPNEDAAGSLPIPELRDFESTTQESVNEAQRQIQERLDAEEAKLRRDGFELLVPLLPQVEDAEQRKLQGQGFTPVEREGSGDGAPSEEANRPTPQPPRKLTPTGEVPLQGEPTPAVRPQAKRNAVQAMWVARQPLNDDALQQRRRLSAALKRYSGLDELPPPRRARELSNILLHEIESQEAFTDEHLTAVERRPLTLEECLTQAAADKRQEAVVLYWQAVRRAAELHLLRDRVEQYEALAHDILARSNDAAHAAAMLDLRVKQLSAQADALQASLFLALAELQLTEALATTSASHVYRPVTLPHMGGYKVLARSEQPGAPEGLAAADVLAWRQIVDQRATAVVRDDAVRAEYQAHYQMFGEDLETAIFAVETQSSDALSFLAALTAYNNSIADYALQVAPPETSVPRLTGTMILAR